MVADYLPYVMSPTFSMPSVVLAKRIKSARLSRGLVQEQWAEIAGLSQGAISAWERGIGFSTCDTVSKALLKAGMDPTIVTGLDLPEGEQARDEAQLLTLYRGLSADERAFVRGVIELQMGRKAPA